MNSFLHKLRWLTRRSDKERELCEELHFHLKEEEEERERDGLTKDEARWAARRELGNLTMLQETTRAAWGWAALERFARDAAFGLRQVRRNPTFSGIAIATLALGTGGITTIFSAFDAVLIRPLPYTAAGRLVMISDDMTGDGLSGQAPAPAEFLEWRRHNAVFTDVAATQPGEATLSGDAAAEQVAARKATANLWSVLGVTPLMGRVFTEEEDEKGARVAVISYGLWQRRYGGSPDIVGRKIIVNDSSYEVTGVMPQQFYFLPAHDIDIWMPASFPAWMRGNFTWHNADVVARLKPGVTLPQAQQSMTALSRKVTGKDFRGPHSVIVKPLRQEMAGKTQTALIALLCASMALLLIACVNLANLLMSRGAARGREVAVRAALGAGRGRLIAQFLTESLVLAMLGAIAGLALSVPAMRFLQKVVPETMGTVRLVLNLRVLAFSAGAAIAAVLIFGLVPALRGSRLCPRDGLREGGRGTTGARRHWLQHSLIVMEVALAVVLLTSGALLLQAFQHLANMELGIRTEKVLTFQTPLFRYQDFQSRVAFVNAQVERVGAVPGVLNAAAISRIPLTGDEATFYLLAGQVHGVIPGQVALFRVMTRDYFATIGAHLREGRFFESPDSRSASPVAIVDDSFAGHNYPGRSPLGEKFKIGRLDKKGYWYTIVGVVKTIRERGIAGELMPTVYLLHEHADQWETKGAQPSWIVVRTAMQPTSIVPAIRQAIGSVDKNQPMWRVQTMEELVDRQLSTPRQSTTLMTVFALLALLLASLGIYGVLAYAVTQRTNEIGVRMALGASSAEILLSFSKRGLALTLTGLAIGLSLTAIASRSMSALLYGFRSDYVPTVTVVSLILLAVAALACFIPARRASRVDPVVALRSE
jgi:putative ABC transport system permease protein